MKRLLGAIAAGFAAGSAVALQLTVLRTLAGVSLPAELVADRVLPQVPVDAFLNLLAKMGGPTKAKEMAFWGGLAGVLAAGLVASAAWQLLRRRRRGGLIAAAALALFSVAVLAFLWPVLGASYVGLPPAWATAATTLALLGAVVLAALVLRAGGPVDGGRRGLLASGAGLAMLAVTGGLAVRLNSDSTFPYDGARLLVRRGARQPVTPVADFYTVTKNLIDPDVDAGLWRLEVTGAVARPYTLTIDELRALDAHSQETTLECISNGIAFGLLSNARWTGPTLRTLLDRAQPVAGARMVELLGVDGYVYPVPLERARAGEVVVAHSMNGEPLVRKHGAPARAVIPGAYGEASAKWLTRITVLEQDEEGYYGRQGWRAGYVHTTSVIDEPLPNQVLAAGTAVVVRGVAFAGERGISAVEVSPDGGRNWLRARLDYAPSPTAWALWSAEWAPTNSGPVTLTVRAYDGSGALQEEAPRGFAPSGATGLHQVGVRVA